MFYTIITIAVILLGCCIIYISLGGEICLDASVQETSVEELSANNTMNNIEVPYVKENNPPKHKNNPIFDGRMLVILFICVAISAVMLFILYFLKLTRKFSTYITELATGIDEISKGNFEHVIMIETKDEFGEIAEKVNAMTKEIQAIMETAQHGEERKHELITSVAHDLRTPLTSIIGYLDLLRSDRVDNSTKDRYINIVYNKSKRLETLIEDLFSYTKYTYGNVATIQDPVDIVKLIEQLMEEFYPSFEDNKIKYSFNKDCPSLISYADGNLLARAFANLIGNAIKYGVEGKKIEVGFKHSEKDMQISVKNYGTIIPEQDLPHIFERFYRVEDSRSQETGGSGLGLAIAKSITVMHHGEIEARSSLDGTVFEITLPIIREPEKKH